MPAPSATVVLLRDGSSGLEVLLLERSRSAGFVPGAWVFPGGQVDPSDAAPEALARIEGVTPASAERHLALFAADPPAAAYYVAALREAFEETGILLAVRADGARIPPAARDPRVARLRDDLLADRIGFADALAAVDGRVPGSEIAYFAHWITPEGLPRRYDTRFFLARVLPGAEASVDPREIVSALWIRPDEAVRAAEEGTLPMILPTVRTLEELAGFDDASEALATLRDREVVTHRPTLPEGASGPTGASR